MSARGSARMTSPSMAKLAVTPPVVGSVSTREVGQPRLGRAAASAAEVLAICISERMPSCMRAPPEAETMMTGTRLCDGQLDGARELLAHHRAHAAAQERRTRRRTARPGSPPMRREAGDRPPPRAPVFCRAAFSAVAVLLGVLEAERIARAQARVALLEGAGVGQQRDALARGDAERDSGTWGRRARRARPRRGR